MRLFDSIRPANMRVTHGLHAARSVIDLSVASAACVEGRLSDPFMVRESGAGMDAPEEIPTGSVKAFFAAVDINDAKYCFGQCQRTMGRGK